jgi:hypothetical protein
MGVSLGVVLAYPPTLLHESSTVTTSLKIFKFRTRRWRAIALSLWFFGSRFHNSSGDASALALEERKQRGAHHGTAEPLTADTPMPTSLLRFELNHRPAMSTESNRAPLCLIILHRLSIRDTRPSRLSSLFSKRISIFIPPP